MDTTWGSYLTDSIYPGDANSKIPKIWLANFKISRIFAISFSRTSGSSSLSRTSSSIQKNYCSRSRSALSNTTEKRSKPPSNDSPTFPKAKYSQAKREFSITGNARSCPLPNLTKPQNSPKRSNRSSRNSRSTNR